MHLAGRSAIFLYPKKMSCHREGYRKAALINFSHRNGKEALPLCHACDETWWMQVGPKIHPAHIWQWEKSWFQQSLGWSFCSFPCKQVILNPPLSRTRLCHSLNTQANTPNQHSTTPITAFVPLTCSVFELNGKWTIQKSVLEVESSKWNQDGFLAFASVDV